MAVEPTTPCEMLAKLKDARTEILLGDQAEEIEYATETGQRRRVRYNMSRMKDLERAIAEYEVLCARSEKRIRRAAMIAGSRLS